MLLHCACLYQKIIHTQYYSTREARTSYYYAEQCGAVCHLLLFVEVLMQHCILGGHRHFIHH